MLPVVWVLEREMFPRSHAVMCAAVRGAGCELREWRDDWRESGGPALAEGAVVFHGSLGNAAAIRGRFPWRPGAYCDTPAFHCSAWYSQAREFLLHDQWRILPANELVATARSVADALDAGEELFVRPGSPLKPFSGRVVQVGRLSLRALDFGFYYEDECLPVVVAPVRKVTHEWRYVVANGTIIAGSAYDATRSASGPDTPHAASWRFAEEIAGHIPAPEAVYILDICQAEGRLHLLELNPFSGADLYACDREAVVRAVSELARESLG